MHVSNRRPPDAEVITKRFLYCRIFLMYTFVCRNAQRPGIIAGMLVSEYELACRDSPEAVVILVHSHKGSRPARVVAEGSMVSELHTWVTCLRPLFVEGESPLLFCGQSGDPLQHISRKLSELAQSFGATIPPATSVRKAIATAGGALDAEKKTALAHSMSHSQSTADSYYRAYGEAQSLQGFQAVGNLLQIPESGRKKRQRFTKKQTELISDIFSSQIELQVQPSGKEFLAAHADVFKGRSRGDIYSKVRNLIGR